MEEQPSFDFYQDEAIPRTPPPVPGPTSDQAYADLIQERKMENILAQINPDNLIADIETRIKGYRKDVMTGQWVKIEGSIEVSPVLVGNFITFLSSFLNNNTTLTNLKDKEINNIMRMVIAYVSDDLRSNQDIYGIKGNYSEMTRIGLIICGATFFTLKRAMNGLESMRIFRQMRIGEMGNPYGDAKPTGITEALKFWK